MRSGIAEKLRKIDFFATAPGVRHQTPPPGRALPAPPANGKIAAMKFFVSILVPLLALTCVLGQTPENSPAPSQIDALTKKVDEINSKLDALSQQILKMEQQMSRPGVMVGEATPAASSSAAPAAALVDPAHSGGSSHVVTRGETLTSIAKQYKVGVEELQKFNHIEDGRKLQAGQTIMIPPAAVPSASPSPSPTE
jgi:LysM repeat protein